MRLLFVLGAYLFSNNVITPWIDDNKIGPEEIEIIVNRHNYWRNEVSVNDLEWSNELASIAEKWAKTLKKDQCGFYHSDFGFGENLWKGTTDAYSTKDVIDSWASEKKDYNYSNNKCETGAMCGHYTQIVWSTTTKVGCARVLCDGNTLWVCEYEPPGNWIDKKPY